MRLLKLKQPHADFGEIRMNLNIHHKIALTFILFNVFFFLYDGIFHLTFEIFHGLFESLEHFLDVLVEEIIEFSTETAPATHETQVIVFYILFVFFLIGCYRLYRFFPQYYQHLKYTFHRQKQTALAEWHELPLFQRFEWWAFLVLYLTALIFFGF